MILNPNSRILIVSIYIKLIYLKNQIIYIFRIHEGGKDDKKQGNDKKQIQGRNGI